MQIAIINNILSNIKYDAKRKKDIILFSNIKKFIKEAAFRKNNFLLFLDYNDFIKYLSINTKILKKTALVVLENSAVRVNSNGINNENIINFRNTGITEGEFDFLIKKGEQCFFDHENKVLKDELVSVKLKLEDVYEDQEILGSIGKLLTKAEKDQNELLRTILYLSRKVTGADGGTIYLLEEYSNKNFLRFKYSYTHSKDVSYEEFLIPLNKKSIAGYTALTGEVVNIENIYKLPKKKYPLIKHNTSFDKEHNYSSKSILTVPMRNHFDKIIGVIQLINCKEDFNPKDNTGFEAFDIKLETKKDFEQKVFPFDKRYETLMLSVSTQAAIALENLFMLKQIQAQLDEFVKASVAAIEDRDSSTSGHSFRVADMCMRLAQVMNNTKSGALKNVRFNSIQMKEIEYASLLHDFGKVSLDFNVFLKEKKLFPKDYSFLILKLDYLYQYLLSKKLKDESGKTEVKPANELFGVSINNNNEIFDKLKKIEEIRKLIGILNEPQIVEKESRNILSRIIKELEEIKCYDPYGNKIEVLTEYEKMNLAISRGSLNPDERRQIESHVELSYKFVKQIPWTEELKNIPEIIYKHHEKLDGSGYPRKLKGKENISMQSRMITICDIYDALTAKDRPYKKAIPHNKVIEILKKEADENKLDKDILELFLKHGVYKS